MQSAKQFAYAAIIPLGHGSHRDSSSLPEGFHSTMALAIAKRSASICVNANSSSRAGSPLLFGLAPRGVFHAPGITAGAVGSYPTFSPLPNDACISSTSRRFPCAMPPCSLRRRSNSLWHFPWRRRSGDFTSPLQLRPLALPGALPFTLKLPLGS